MEETSLPGPNDLLFSKVLSETRVAVGLVLLPASLLYATIYAIVKGRTATGLVGGIATVAVFVWVHLAVQTGCAALRALVHFTVAVGIMKTLNILTLRHNLPTLTASRPKPRPLILSFILLTELRYESFTPNTIRLSPLPEYPFPRSLHIRQIFYSEHIQLLIHILVFAVLQSLPQYNVIKAYGILLTIYNIWTSLQLLLRYHNSPPLFGPVYLASSLATFWTETWHNVFTAPCLNLAYRPTSRILRSLGTPKAVSRSFAVVSGFALMAVFHMYALSPLLGHEGKRRVGIFFIANGVLTVMEVGVWGTRRHWIRAVLAWAVMSILAAWTFAAIPIADGVLAADWKGLCTPWTE